MITRSSSGLVVLVLIALVPASHATTFRPITVTCPFDRTVIRGHALTSTFISGVTPDLRPLGVGAYGPTASLIDCPTCGFVAQPDEFEEAGELEAAAIGERLRALRSPPLFSQLDRAALVESLWKRRQPTMAAYALAAKWLADETGEPAVIDARRRAAIDAHARLLDNPEADAPTRAQIAYLIGELHRQAGDRDEALAWFDRARETLPEEELPLLEAQAFRARVAGKPWTEVLTAAKVAPIGGRMAAVELLRDVDDPEVLGFIEEVVLRSPEQAREPAMEALLGLGYPTPVPPRRYLPLFLQAIRSDHYRTVQGGARAIELLRAREAAPALLEAFRAADDFTEYRLGSALAAVATADQVAALQDLKLRPHHLFRALVNTSSPAAAQPIVEIARRERVVVSFYSGDDDEDVRLSLPPLAPALLPLLPDPNTADDNDPLATLAVEVLAAINTAETRDQLAAMLHRADTLAELAALRLIEQGDGRGKPLLVTRVEHLITRDNTSHRLLIPLLEPADYPALAAQLEAERAERRDYIEQMRRDLADPSMATMHDHLKQQLERHGHDTEFWMESWLPLLGATRHPEASGILLQYLVHENPQARAGAAEGLGLLGDPAHLPALVDRLADEQPMVQEAIVRAIGRLRGGAGAAPIIALRNQPTLVSVKLAMIEALRVLDPAAGRPLLEEWRQSPLAELAAAARAAIADWPG